MSQDTWNLETHKKWAELGWRILEHSRARIRKWFQLPDNDVVQDLLCDYELGEKSLEETLRALKAEKERAKNQGG